MKKAELLNALKFAWELEESHVPVIMNFFLEDFDWSGVDEEKARRVKKILEVIKSQTLNHSKILNDLMASVKEGGESEF